MALHLNLYHEIKKQAVQRQRDPLKLGTYGIVAVVGILLVYYFYRVEQVGVVTSRAVKLQAQWRMAEPKAKDALLLETQLNANIKTKEDLVQTIENRFYWAPLLERIQKTVPRNVQITSFHGTMEPGSGRGLLTLSGLAAGVEARKVAEDFRTSFATKCLEGYSKVNSNFGSLEDSDATVQLDGKAINAALFSLQFQFAVAEPTPAPTPVQRVQKGSK